jgi:hypothetical protein
MKYFRMSYDEVLNKRSYLTLILLNAAIPSVKPFDEQQQDDDEQQQADSDDIDAIAQRASKKGSKKNSYQEVDDVFMRLM